MTEVQGQENTGAMVAALPLSVVFANTVYAEHGTLRDTVDTPEKLAAWLGRHRAALSALTDPVPPMTLSAVSPLSVADLADFLALRDAIRVLIDTVVDEAPAAPEALAVLNRCAIRVPAWPELVPGPADGRFRRRLRGAAGRPAYGALGTLARDAIDLLSGEDVVLLRACQAPGCVQYFRKDHHRRNWCSPACGNRARVAKHYARTRTGLRG